MPWWVHPGSTLMQQSIFGSPNEFNADARHCILTKMEILLRRLVLACLIFLVTVHACPGPFTVAQNSRINECLLCQCMDANFVMMYLLQETSPTTVVAITRALTDTLNTGVIDYLTPENTALVDERQLPPLLPGSPGTGRRRLTELEVRQAFLHPIPTFIASVSLSILLASTCLKAPKRLAKPLMLMVIIPWIYESRMLSLQATIIFRYRCLTPYRFRS